MPIQIWIGSHTNNLEYRTLQHDNHVLNLWKHGIVLRIHHHHPKKIYQLPLPNLSSSSSSQPQSQQPDGGSSYQHLYDDNDDYTFDISYLHNMTDVNETIETNVTQDRIHIMLNNSSLVNDDDENGEEDSSMIPSTIEEATLTLPDGEEHGLDGIGIGGGEFGDTVTSTLPSQLHQSSHPTTQTMDENTGLSTWNTVSVLKTTQHLEMKQERERKR